ncbi:unnamed protein product [Mytilus coruscus]|uniref:Uncharacterized protein n=1 Tax=Mytilus coruscus TaxID=42192 RepID=A0A6J7ZZJ3_MYTCO|nr:unnamed protein product [Mytilus coruscus]
MTSKLQQDFLLLFQCIIDFGADVLRDCTKMKMKTIYQTDNFKIFLGKTKHHLFHQLPKQNPICCACPITGCSIRKTGHVDRRIFDKFYFNDKTLPIPPGHHAANGKKVPQICICRFVENNKVLDDLDLSDLNCLLRNLSIMTSIEENLLKELMEVRGKVCHTVTTKTFSQHELTNLWTTFMNSVCTLCPSDPKYLKKAIDLTKSSVLSDDKILELIEKVQQVITDCLEIKPVIMEYTEKFNVFENRQNEHNIRVETRLARLESLFMGHFEAKHSNTQATISVYDSEKSNMTDVTYSGKQGDRYIECEANCPGLDEDKALKRLATETDVNCSKKLKIESVEKHCILLKLSTRPELFESKEILHSAIMALVQKISDAGDLDTSVDRKMDIKITFTSPLTDDERHTIVSMLGAYGSINEGYKTETTDRDEGIGDIDSNEMDYSDNNRHDDKKMVFPKEEYMAKLENPFNTIKKEAMRNMPMDLPDNFLKNEPNETKSLDFQSGAVEMAATEKQDEEIFLRIGNMKCLWRIKGLPNKLQHLDDNQDISVEEGKQIWYLQWRLECPQGWDISTVVEKMNTNKRSLFFNIDYVHSEIQSKIVVETNTKKEVFNNYSSAELAFKTFLAEIVKICDLETTEPFNMTVTTSVLAVIEQQGMETKNSMEDNDIICEHCKNVTSCYKCTETLELVMELTSLLKTNDELIERLAQNMKMTKEEMIDGLDKRMSSGKDTTNEVLDPAKLSSNSDKELIEIEEKSEEYVGKTKSPELHNEPRYGNVLVDYKDMLGGAYTQKSGLGQVQRQQHLLQDEQQQPSQYTPEKQNKGAIVSSSIAPVSTRSDDLQHVFASLLPNPNIWRDSSQVDQAPFSEFLKCLHHQYQSDKKRPSSTPSSTDAIAGSPLLDIGVLEDSDTHSTEFAEYPVRPMAYIPSNLKHLQQLQQTQKPSFSIGSLTSLQQRLTRSPSPPGLGVGKASDTYSAEFASPALPSTFHIPYQQEWGSDQRASLRDRYIHPNSDMTDVTTHEDQFEDSSSDAYTVKPSDRKGYDERLKNKLRCKNMSWQPCGEKDEDGLYQSD